MCFLPIFSVGLEHEEVSVDIFIFGAIDCYYGVSFIVLLRVGSLVLSVLIFVIDSVDYSALIDFLAAD